MGTINDYGEFALWQEGFKITDETVDSARNNIRYFGYVTRDGDWQIMKVNYSDPKEWRFVKGRENYEENWSAREELDYLRFNVEFR